MLRRSVSYLCYAYYYDWQANSRRKSFCLSSFHDPLPAKRCETTAIITIVPCHALCQQSSPLCHWTVIPALVPCAAYNHCQRYSFIHSCTTSRLHHLQLRSSSIQSARRIVRARRAARSTPALVAFCCHACVYTFTFTFTLRKHHFYATSNAQGFVASTAAVAAAPATRRDGSAKSVAYFAAHLVKLFICPYPLPLLCLSLSVSL